MLFLLDTAAFVAVIIAWFAILFTGRLPAGLFDFVAGVLRWHNPHCGLRSQSGHRPVPLFPTPNDRPASLGQRRRPLEQIIYRRSR